MGPYGPTILLPIHWGRTAPYTRYTVSWECRDMKRRYKRKASAEMVFIGNARIDLDEDVVALLNASVKNGVKWDTRKQAINAGLRLSFLKFAPNGFQPCFTPLEQLVFAKPVKGRRK